MYPEKSGAPLTAKGLASPRTSTRPRSSSGGSDLHSPPGGLHYLSYHPLQLSDHNEPAPAANSTADDSPAALPGASQKLLKTLLVAFGLLSAAQFALAIALICHPHVFSIAIQDDPKSSYISYLPAIFNITNKTAEGWLAAAVALIGLIVWERHLTTKDTSLKEMDAWGSLLSNDLPGTLMNLRRLEVVPLGAFLFVIGLTAAATTAVTNAVTPFPGETTVERAVNLPSLLVADPSSINTMCARDDGSACRQNSESG